MNVKGCRRAGALAFVLLACIVRFWVMRLRGPRTPESRVLWLRRTCIQVLHCLRISLHVEGQIPTRGLVVANHLSYFDIVVLVGAMSCSFVSKAEVGGWPFFGKVARSGGTIFLDRSSLASAEQVALAIADRLRLNVPVVFFPEGTSTDGSSVLRFHSRLFEPAITNGIPITAAALQYTFDDGTAEEELCWYGDASLGPHLVKTLSGPGFSALLRFGEPEVFRDRRTAAQTTRDEIVAMRARGVTAAPKEAVNI
jgi:lyso-ornithine lipid O-acyltransferase